MKTIHRATLISIAMLLVLAGCTLRLSGRQAQTPELPTFDPALLSITLPPTSTLPPTYTPHPTVEHLPTHTPFPTFPPRLVLTSTPELLGGAGAGGGAGRPAPLPTPTFFYIGIPDVSPKIAELEPILTFVNDGVKCGETMLMQVGVINWGTYAAHDFVVEWSAGLPIEAGVETIDILEWGTLPYYFRNKEIRFPCTETTTYYAYVRVDVTNVVLEIDETNNTIETTFTIPYVPDND